MPFILMGAWVAMVYAVCAGVEDVRNKAADGGSLLRALLALAAAYVLVQGRAELGLIVAAALGAVIWFVRHGPTRAARLSADLLMRFVADRSAAFCGIAAAAVLAAALFATGLLGPPGYWLEDVRALPVLLASILLGGAAAGLLRVKWRRRWPEPVEFAVFAFGSIAGVGKGFYYDEVLIPILATPLLWVGLTEVQPVWTIFFWGGAFVLTSIVLTAPWALMHTAFLRWAGQIDEADRMLYEAYESLIRFDQIQRWLGHLSIRWEADGGRYVVQGDVPDFATRQSLERRLAAIARPDGGNAAVDVQAVRLDPSLEENPRLALARSVRARDNLGRYWPFR